MLRLENVVKNYEVSGASFPALKGISLAFRKNEFVSILGPSGCGKTTLLNIIGGLDHYTSGDLVIEGKSTKQYNSHDWDIYRNYRIGFIFQSYNLIPHQNILENVELALTIAGYSKEEKRKKALNALAKVGLKNAWKKMPNQLSGGQCQRVAIARALVNEPDILLGDEPTGALDSKTSVQVMELIKKISKTKLVIMVTHNPELAKQYSSRIISLLDGEVVKDTDKYSLAEEKKEKREEFKGIKVSSKTTALAKPSEAKMSWWDAFKLSAKNLISKRKRTLMVIAASSIGIVGVSAVLAVSTGVKSYIAGMENDMLSASPIRASETSLDLASVLSNLSNLVKAQAISQSFKEGVIDIEYLTKLLIENAKSGSIITNDVSDYYVEYAKEISTDLAAEVSVSYGLSFANNIYTISEVAEDDAFYKGQKVAYSMSGLKNIYTSILATLKDDKGTSFLPLANVAANFPNVFYQGLDNNKYLSTQYDVVTGRFPDKNKSDECVVVLNRRNKLNDLVVALTGMFSQKDFMKAMWEFIKPNPDMSKVIKDLKLERILGQKFFYVPNNYAFYENSIAEYKYYDYNYRFKYDETNSTLENGEHPGPIEITGKENEPMQIKIVGIITPKEGRNYGSLSSGIYFNSSLANKVLNENGKSNLALNMIKTNRPSFNNIVFIPDDEKIASTKTGLSYPLNFHAINEDGTEGDLIKSYGTVGDSCLIIPDSKNPFKEPEEEPESGTIIESSITSRSLTGLKAIKVVKENGNDTYDFKKCAYRVELYSEDFGKKDGIVSYLDKWNGKEPITINDPYNPGKKIELAGVGTGGKNARTLVTYNDNLTIIIAMINNLINTTTISLTVFASLALVVSTVMIGIITYISVMERIKEIGVIRALGGRKKDVRHLFNAETFILGSLGGLFGVTITYVFEIVLDIVIYANFKIPYIAQLRWYTALIMILLSIVLTAISGIIPASSAAKKDPVTSLRTE